MLQTSEIQYRDSFYDVTLVVKQGNLADGMRHAALQGESMRAGEAVKLDLPGSLGDLIAIHIRPSCLASLHSVENRGERKVTKEPTLDEFMEYPDALVDLWQTAVWELNPHWSPFGRSAIPSNSSTENSSSGTPEKQV